MTLRILMHTVLEYTRMEKKTIYSRPSFDLGKCQTESFLMPSNDTALIMNKLIYEYLSILYSRELVTV